MRNAERGRRRGGFSAKDLRFFLASSGVVTFISHWVDYGWRETLNIMRLVEL
jgi:hypothetical protein